MEGKLSGKKALVTGGSSGIGRAIALELAREGAEVALHYHGDDAAAATVVAEIERQGGKVLALKADFRNIGEVNFLAGAAWERMHRIDFLVNNAGVSYKRHFLNTTEEDVRHFIDINFIATFFLTQAVARKMVAGNVAGSIYTVTSINALQPGVGLSAYGASKAALETLMKGIALELAPHHIKVNTIAPGAIHTDMNKAVWEDTSKLKMLNEHIPIGRMGEAEEVASIIASLLASGSYMTGVTITLDGGWSLKRGFNNPEKYNPPI